MRRSGGKEPVQCYATRGEEPEYDEEVEPIMQDWHMKSIDGKGMEL